MKEGQRREKELLKMTVNKTYFRRGIFFGIQEKKNKTRNRK